MTWRRARTRRQLPRPRVLVLFLFFSVQFSKIAAASVGRNLNFLKNQYECSNEKYSLKKGFFFCENHVSIKLVDVLKICLGKGRANRRGRDKTRRGRREKMKIMEPEPE